MEAGWERRRGLYLRKKERKKERKHLYEDASTSRTVHTTVRTPSTAHSTAYSTAHSTAYRAGQASSLLYVLPALLRPWVLAGVEDAADCDGDDEGGEEVPPSYVWR